MPIRQFSFITGQIYHVYNRGIDHRPTFTTKREYGRSLMALQYYQYNDPTVSLSRYLSMQASERAAFFNSRLRRPQIVELLAFCLMPNHYHFLVRQTVDGGISTFISRFQNSYTRYFNTRHQRRGPLFETQFKAVPIESQLQLLHLSRYIHLNPYAAGLTHHSSIVSYPWSSMSTYIQSDASYSLHTDKILESFASREDYRQFVLDRADEQRSLSRIKHLAFEYQAS